MTYVFDASFVGAIIIPDERNPGINKIQAGIGEEEDIFVPQLLWYEIASIFRNLIRRKRYTPDEVLQFIPLLAAIRLETDHETGADYSQQLLRLCNEHNLSSYDAAYLELAERTNAVLCTLDEDLRVVAKKRGVAVMK
jgi:predicted nucleic acid-binding protein